MKLFKSKLIRSVTLLLTTCSYQGLILLGEANFSTVAAQTAPRLCAAPGKDGAGINLSGVINTYYPGRADVNAGATSIPVGTTPTGASTQIQDGDLLLVIQMQGADIDSTNTDAYGDGIGGDVRDNVPLGPDGEQIFDELLLEPPATGASGNLDNANFTAGNYEYVVARGDASSGSVIIEGAGTGGGLINSYSNAPFGTQGQRTYQVIRVPQYSSATLTSTSVLTARPWNGSTGGVLAYDVADTLNFNDATVNVSGIGFRGGGGRELKGIPMSDEPPFIADEEPTDYRTSSNREANGSKGEGTAGTPRFLFNPTTTSLEPDTGNEGYPDGSYGRGAPGNAGGGGTDGTPYIFILDDEDDEIFFNGENSGGGGGGNGGAGGLGGRTFKSNYYTGGFGGAAFPSTSNRLVLGGGGGAGTTDNGSTGAFGVTPQTDGEESSGAAGGGIVFIRTASVSGSGTINADGANALDVGIDGGGGGGAGGSVVVSAANNNLIGLTVTANGGRGGDAIASNPHGPGGGGGGGVIFTSPGAFVTANGGAPGATGNPIVPNQNLGATAGSNGTTSNVGNINGASSGAECLLPQLTITKTTSTLVPIIKPGKATYTITVDNAANLSTATNVNISDPFPSGFTYDASVEPIITLSGGSTRTSTSNPSDGDTTANFGAFNIPGGGSVAIRFTTNIDENAPNGVYNNPATATYTDATNTTKSVSYDAATVGEEVTVGSPVPNDPERLRGLKRITNVFRNGVAIGGIDFNSFIDDPNDPIDNLPGWFQLSPVGVFDISPQLPLERGDEVEYTMYFLADGNRPVEDVRFCDPIPQGTSFVADSFGSGSGISVNLSGTVTANTNNNDADNGSFFAPGTQLPVDNFCPNQDNPTGAVIGNLSTINHMLGNNFGFIRFRVKID